MVADDSGERVGFAVMRSRLVFFFVWALFGLSWFGSVENTWGKSPHPDSETTATLSGTIRDRAGNPMPGVYVCLKATDFSEIITTTTDQQGRYALKAPRGDYYSFYACRDYAEKNLEYWAWDIPLYTDRRLDAFVDRLEVYGLNAVHVRYNGFRSIYLQFRPMSLSKAKKLGLKKGAKNMSRHIDLAPKLQKTDLVVTIDDHPAKVLNLTAIPETCSSADTGDEWMDGYLVQVALPEACKTKTLLKIVLHLREKQTGEEGEGCVFLKTPPYVTRHSGQ